VNRAGFQARATQGGRANRWRQRSGASGRVRNRRRPRSARRAAADPDGQAGSRRASRVATQPGQPLASPVPYLRRAEPVRRPQCRGHAREKRASGDQGRRRAAARRRVAERLRRAALPRGFQACPDLAPRPGQARDQTRPPAPAYRRGLAPARDRAVHPGPRPRRPARPRAAARYGTPRVRRARPSSCWSSACSAAGSSACW
jgi:hypothetical protein